MFTVRGHFIPEHAFGKLNIKSYMYVKKIYIGEINEKKH